jgi:5-methylcytosine-specific restriction endonuclease McrA
MPYQRNGKRNYRAEYDKYHSKPEQRANRSERTVARREANESGVTRKGDNTNLDHRVPLSKGGTSAKSNLRVVSESKNKSFSRNKDGSMKSQTSKREKKK